MVEQTALTLFCDKDKIIASFLAENPVYHYDFRGYVLIMLICGIVLVFLEQKLEKNNTGIRIINIAQVLVFGLSLALFLFLLFPDVVL